MIPVVVISSLGTSKAEMTSASMAEISSSLNDAVTALDTSTFATNPVIDGFALGTLVVGDGTG